MAIRIEKITAITLMALWLNAASAWGPGDYYGLDPWSTSYSSYPYQQGARYPGWRYPGWGYWGASPWSNPYARRVDYYGPWGRMYGVVTPTGDFWMNITVSGSLVDFMNELQMRAVLAEGW